MSLGTLYTRPFNPRSTAILAVAKANKLSLDLVTIASAQEATDHYRKFNPLAKIPTFVGSDGYVLSECIAIAVYITSLNEKTTLLGDTKQDYASILRWMSFANSEILPSLGGWFNPLIGRAPFNQQELDQSMNATLQRLRIMEDHLSVTTYLVGERLTLADLFVTGVVAGGFMFFFDKAWRAEHPAVTRWFEHVYAQPIYADVAGRPVLVEKAIPNTFLKQEGEPTQEIQAEGESMSKVAELSRANDDGDESKPTPQAHLLVPV